MTGFLLDDLDGVLYSATYPFYCEIVIRLGRLALEESLFLSRIDGGLEAMIDGIGGGFEVAMVSLLLLTKGSWPPSSANSCDSLSTYSFLAKS